MYYLPDTLIHDRLESSMGLIHFVSFEPQCRANNRNIPSCKKKKKKF